MLRPFLKVRSTLEDLPRNPSPDQVHRFRLRLRRIEAVLDALGMNTSGLGRRLLRHERPLRVRAGKIHDMDVFTRLLGSMKAKNAEEGRTQMLQYVGVQRYHHVRKLHKEVDHAEGKLHKELGRCIRRIEKRIGPQASTRAKLLAAAMITARILEWGAELARYPRLSRSNLHLFRIRLRHMRRILQMADECGTPFFYALADTKNAIGEWHDWDKLARAVRRAKPATSRLLLAEITAITDATLQRALGLSQRLREDHLQTLFLGKKSVSETSKKTLARHSLLAA